MGDEYYKKLFSKNLRNVMSANGKTQVDLIKDLGITRSAISTWVNGTRLPRMDKVDMLAKYFNCKRSDLIEEPKEEPAPPARKGITVNVLGRVAACIPIDAIEDIIDTEEITPELARTGKFFGLKIKGDSMAPLINDGDTVIVKQQDDADNGDIIIAIINGDDGCCKKLQKFDGGVMLVSINPDYPPRIYNHADIDTIPVRIAGKVIELRRKF